MHKCYGKLTKCKIRLEFINISFFLDKNKIRSRISILVTTIFKQGLQSIENQGNKFFGFLNSEFEKNSIVDVLFYLLNLRLAQFFISLDRVN